MKKQTVIIIFKKKKKIIGVTKKTNIIHMTIKFRRPICVNLNLSNKTKSNQSQQNPTSGISGQPYIQILLFLSRFSISPNAWTQTKP